MSRKDAHQDTGVALGERLRNVFEKHIVFVVISIYAAGIGTGAALTPFFARLSEGKKATAAEDLATVTALSQALHDSQASNALYAEFLKNVDANTPFSDYFRTYDAVRQTKERLLQQLKTLQPTSRFARLYEVLTQSLLSDARLMGLEKQSLQHTLDALKVLQVPPPADGLPEQEQRRLATENLLALQQRIKQWREQAGNLEAALKSARGTSSTAVQLLNEELRQAGLGYEHDNPFVGRAVAPPVPTPVPGEASPPRE